MRRSLLLSAALLLAAAALAGCGDDDGTATTAPSGSEATTATTAAATTTAATTPTTEAPAGTAATTLPPVDTTPPETAAPVEFAVSTDAFADGGDIPVQFTCDGANEQPGLMIAGVPDGTVSLALAVVDPDGGDWIHWVIWNLPPDAAWIDPNLPAGDLPDGSRQAANDYAQVFSAGELFPGGGEIRINGWDGPCPGPQPHRYYFTLYALTGTIDLPTGTPGADILAALEAARADGSLIGEASLLGMYPPAG